VRRSLIQHSVSASSGVKEDLAELPPRDHRRTQADRLPICRARLKRISASFRCEQSTELFPAAFFRRSIGTPAGFVFRVLGLVIRCFSV
jgi:hypothetical protein